MEGKDDRLVLGEECVKIQVTQPVRMLGVRLQLHQVDNIHVRGYKEEGTITTPFDMTVLNDLDRFHLVMDTIDRVPETGEKGIYLRQQLKDKLVEHKHYICKHGQDLPEIRDWKWSDPNQAPGSV